MITSALQAQVKEYSFDEVEVLNKAEPRKTIVFIYAEWCRYCEAMKRTTLENSEIIERLNDVFYFIEFNGESQQNVYFNDIAYRFIPSGKNTGTHELARELGSIDGKLSYPTLVVLDTDWSIIYKTNGFVKAKALLTLLEELEID